MERVHQRANRPAGGGRQHPQAGLVGNHQVPPLMRRRRNGTAAGASPLGFVVKRPLPETSAACRLQRGYRCLSVALLVISVAGYLINATTIEARRKRMR